MASGPVNQDLCCPICWDVFSSPVVLSCSHSFCKDCLTLWWREKESRECPICKAVSSTADPPVSLNLKNLCEAFLLERELRASGAACSVDPETLDLLRRQHQRPLCLVHSDEEEHTNHTSRAMGEAARPQKTPLEKMNEELKVFKEVEFRCVQALVNIVLQAQETEGHVQEQFEKLHQFLRGEEEAQLAAVRVEAEQKTEAMNEKIKALSREIKVLSGVIRAREEELRDEDAAQAAVEPARPRLLLDDPRLSAGALLDLAQHPGNISYTPVILDPNTGRPKLVLPEDPTRVRGQEDYPPSSPETFDSYVLGSEGFHSGTHSWDVEVGNSPRWILGVVAESVRRSGIINSGVLLMSFVAGRYLSWSPLSSLTDLGLQRSFQRIRVCLDLLNGSLSFSDPDTNTHIHTLTHTFTERMFPYICTWNEVRISPHGIHVAVAPSR